VENHSDFFFFFIFCSISILDQSRHNRSYQNLRKPESKRSVCKRERDKEREREIEKEGK
jgi:hypothetical protein